MKKFKISSLVYVALFVLLIGVVGFFSAKKLVSFYVNDEIVNNEYDEERGSKLEMDIASNFFGQFEFVNINGLFHRILGQREMNEVVKLKNGHLYHPIGYVDDETLEKYADRVALFDKYLESRGTDLIYIMTPYQICPYHDYLPEGIEEYGNSDVDRMFAYLDVRGVDTLDIRKRMHDDGIDQCDMIYITDHHWTTQAGFYAYGLLEDYIKDKTGCEVDAKITDESQYDIRKYEKWHLGSWGNDVGRYFAGVDDFYLYVPKFDTNLTNDFGQTGKMQELAYNMEPLQKRDVSSKYTYDHVLTNSAQHFVNNDCINDVKVLIVGDSFSRTVCPFLAMGYSEMDFMPDYETSRITMEYIEKYDPDVVIMLYYPSFGIRSTAYEFQVPEDLN
ncbi:MAG: hypothetical protein KBS96_00700 [Lachnospiraceae bacterium]|nr:hypothetical protein [Candidatus Colinaster scatohippi]